MEVMGQHTSLPGKDNRKCFVRKRIATLPHDIIGEMQEQHDKSSDKGTAKG